MWEVTVFRSCRSLADRQGCGRLDARQDVDPFWELESLHDRQRASSPALALSAPDPPLSCLVVPIRSSDTGEKRLKIVESMTQLDSQGLDAWALLEHMTESVLVTSTDLERPGPTILYVNAAFERMTGWKRAEVLGRSPRFLQGAKTDPSVFADLREQLNRGRLWKGQTVNYRKNGDEFVMEWSIVPLVDSDGSISCHLAVQRDVTERVALEQQLAQARTEEQRWLGQVEKTNKKLVQLNEEQQDMLNLFIKYVPEAVVRRGLQDQDGALFHGMELEIALLFCDLRGFTSISEQLAPDGVVQLLNAYYQIMTEVISRHGGVIQQFVGDEIFVAFGAPQPLRDSVDHAVRCALDMVDQMQVINERLRELIGTPLHVGIGVHYGPVVAGNLGSEKRLSYSITGDTVNTAKRIESLSPGGRNTVLMSEIAHQQLRATGTVQPWSPVTVKGREEPVRLFEVLALTAPAS